MCDDNGFVEYSREGAIPCTTGKFGSINETARWQSTQCVQVPDGGVSPAGWEPWQGIDDVTASDGAALTSASRVFVGAFGTKITHAFPNMPEIGMTAAMAPETGSQISIQKSKNLLKNVIRIGQDYREKVPKRGKKLFTRHLHRIYIVNLQRCNCARTP